MKKIKSYLSIMAFCFLWAQNADASVTINVSADYLKNASGSGPIPSNALVILVADTGNDGFGAIASGASLALNGAIDGAGGDDLVLARWAAGGSSGEPGAFYDTTGQLAFPGGTTNWSVGDGLALLWFPALTTASTNATSGSEYGLYSGPGSTGSAAWTTPGDGATIALSMLTTDAAVAPGNLTANTGNASLTVAAVPEPSRAILGLMGLSALFLRRRRHV